MAEADMHFQSSVTLFYSGHMHAIEVITHASSVWERRWMIKVVLASGYLLDNDRVGFIMWVHNASHDGLRQMFVGGGLVLCDNTWTNLVGSFIVHGALIYNCLSIRLRWNRLSTGRLHRRTGWYMNLRIIVYQQMKCSIWQDVHPALREWSSAFAPGKIYNW